MEKVLVIGASGNLGINVIKYLLSEGKYEITALDLHNSRAHQVLKKYRKRINIIYGDINDRTLIDNLITEHNIVYALAGVLPPLSEIKKNLAYNIEYKGIGNVVRAIKAYNPGCQLIYSSSTSIYGKQEKEVSIKTKIINNEWDLYNTVKLDCEKLISKELKNYIIFRLPLIIGNLKNDYPIYSISASNKMELITSTDAAYGLVAALNSRKNLNKHIYNMTGGEACTTTMKAYFNNILSIYGLSFRFVFSRLLVPRNFYLTTYSDGNDLEDKLHFRSESLSSYYIKLKRTKSFRRRFINRLLAWPIRKIFYQGEDIK